MGNRKVVATDIKIRNRQLIYQFIREQGSVSKQDIVFGLQLSLPTVTQNLQNLKKQGLIDDSQKIKNTGGRNATAYTYIRDAKVAIGVYISAHHMNGVAVDLSGEEIVMVRKRIKFNLDDDEYLRQLGLIVEEIKEKAGVLDENLLGVGIGLPGLVSEDGEEVLYGLTLNFTGKTRAQIAKYIPYRNRLFHDSYVAGYAEVWNSEGLENAFYISLSNSIGGSVVMNGEIYEGSSHKGGEIGHMIVEPHSEKICYCGGRGCFDTVCNAGVLDHYTDGNLEKFFQLLEQKDETAVKLWDEYLDYLSVAVVNIRVLFDNVIILGGYVGAYIDNYMEELYQRVDQRFPFDESARDYLIPCRYKVEAAAAGAAISYIEEFFGDI